MLRSVKNGEPGVPHDGWARLLPVPSRGGYSASCSHTQQQRHDDKKQKARRRDRGGLETMSMRADGVGRRERESSRSPPLKYNPHTNKTQTHQRRRSREEARGRRAPGPPRSLESAPSRANAKQQERGECDKVRTGGAAKRSARQLRLYRHLRALVRGHSIPFR